MQILKQWLLMAAGVVLAASTSPGITYGESLGTLFLAVVLLSAANVVLRPLLILFALPFVVMTLGLGLVLINALLFWLVAEIVPGFEVVGFWSAVWGAIVLSLTNMLANAIFGKREPGGGQNRHTYFRVNVNRDDSADSAKQKGQGRVDERHGYRPNDDVIDI